MDEIEATVELPENARGIEEYSRHFAYESDKTLVKAIFLIPDLYHLEEKPDDWGCEVMLEDFSSRPCSEEEIAEMDEMDREHGEYEGMPNSRRWHETSDDLPMWSDGGCSIITVEYDIAARRFDRVQCNGSV